MKAASTQIQSFRRKRKYRIRDATRGEEKLKNEDYKKWGRKINTRETERSTVTMMVDINKEKKK